MRASSKIIQKMKTENPLHLDQGCFADAFSVFGLFGRGLYHGNRRVSRKNRRELQRISGYAECERKERKNNTENREKTIDIREKIWYNSILNGPFLPVSLPFKN